MYDTHPPTCKKIKILVCVLRAAPLACMKK